MRKNALASLSAEKKLFFNEIEDLKPYAKVKPRIINPLDIHDEAILDEIRRLDPYFILTLGGPLYKKQLLELARGLAINQHAGHSPDMKGSRTTEWALFHRNIRYVSNTIHILSTGADDGPILRRSNPCMFRDDTINTIFLRVVALGTELMIEVVQDIILNKKVTIYRQPRMTGRTYLGRDFSTHIMRSLVRDFKSGWLNDELKRQELY